MVTGIGSWPGTDIRETVRMVRDLLTTPAEGVVGLPYLPELPARGPGADLVGRGLSLLVDLPVDLQPSGWRLTDRSGRDLGRSEALMRQDLDELAEAFDGWTGPFKVQVTGPWTLAASTWLPRGERVLSDEGATREVVDSLAEGVRQYLARVARLLPGADLVLQVDEPSLPAALEGRLPTASGFGMVRTVDPQVAVDGLTTVLRGAPDGTRPVVHCCAAGIPVALLRRTGADLSTDTSLLTGSTWEGVAVGLEEGMTLYAGSVPTTRPSGRAQDVASALAGRWAELGLSRSTLADLVVTPACGLAGLTPEAARNVSSVCIDVAAELAELAQA
jgi:methionine synthase II (cobalamin-independent)